MTADASPRRPVMADVARLAGVSHQTVSRVINGSTSIRPSTRARVERAIADLGYHPNTAARALVTQALQDHRDHRQQQRALRPVEHPVLHSGSGKGGWLLHQPGDSWRGDPRRAAGSAGLPDRQSVEAIVMIVTQQDALAVVRSGGHRHAADRRRGRAVRARPAASESTRSPGRAMATQHLVDLGHRDIVHVTGPADLDRGAGRRAGYVEAMRAAGLPAARRSGRRLESGPRLRDRQGAGQARRLLRGVRRQRPDGDRSPARVCQGRRRVPDDVSVIAFDDIPEAGYLNPALSTVRQDFHAVGQRAIELLTAVLGGTAIETPLLAPELVIRDSTAPTPTPGEDIHEQPEYTIGVDFGTLSARARCRAGQTTAMRWPAQSTSTSTGC